MTAIPKHVALFETTLANKISSSATSLTLVSGTDKAGNTLSGTIGFIIDEGTASEEFVMGTVSGTAVSGLTRGLDPQNPSTEVAALKKEHRRGATVKVTDYPIIGRIGRILNGDDTLPNKVSYASAPSFTGGSNELASVKFVEDTANAGAADASTTVKGLAEEATQAEIDADTAAGGAARLFVNPSTLATSKYGTQLPSSDEKAALAGSSGTPSTSNKYVTADDAAENTNSKLVRRKSDGNLTVPATPSATTDATSKSYVDANFNLAQQIWSGYQSTNGNIYLISATSLPTAPVDIYVAIGFSSSSDKIIKYTKNASTNLYYNSGTSVQVEDVGNISNGQINVAALGSYVYASLWTAAGNYKLHRYDIGTLANAAVMTISGTAPTGGGAGPYPIFSDGTFLYICDGSTQTDLKKYSISGTTATYVATISFTSFVKTYGAWCDGTSVYQYDGTTISKWALAGGARSSTTAYNMSSGGAATTGGCSIVGYSSTMQFLLLSDYLYSSTPAINGIRIIATPVLKP